MYHFEPLTAFLDSIEANFGTPAVDMLIMKEGKEIYRHSAGHPDPEKQKPVSDKDLYWIYSASKISTCTAALTLIGSIRELIGRGSVFNMQILGATYEPMLLILMPAGGFLMFGLILGIVNTITSRHSKKKEGASA